MNSDAIESALIHELVHIYDIWTRQMDLQDCHQLAYSEVRAVQEGESQAAWWPASCVKEQALTSPKLCLENYGELVSELSLTLPWKTLHHSVQ